MTKTVELPKLRVEPKLAERVKADQAASGERAMAMTLRRLIERGLGNPYLTEKDCAFLVEMLYELRRLAQRLNDIDRRRHLQGVAQEDDELRAVAQSISQTNNKIHSLLSRSR
jgi:hypothetical protein